MKKLFLFILICFSNTLFSQTQLSEREFSINGFRNPSLGLEYRYAEFSVHIGFYPTIISKDANGVNETTSFARAGVSVWFLPVGIAVNPSSFYASLSLVRGLNKGYEADNGLLIDTGFRWMAWEGLNLRIGAALLASSGHKPRLNPTPGISYSFFFN